MCIVMQYRHNDYVEKVMTIYSYDDPYIVINICHKHDARVYYDDFNNRYSIFVTILSCLLKIVINKMIMMNYSIVIAYLSQKAINVVVDLLDMARIMLDEYKTPDRFWAEAINTACYSINRLYLHRILNKTSYELLTDKKPNVSYFRVFGSKCFILIKRGRNSKFAPKAVEGFLLGYDSNARAYRVFNKSTGLVEVSCDIVFDETNSSQVEQVVLDELDDEEALCVALRNMSIGDVCPKETKEPPQAQDQPSSSTQASPPTQDEEMAQEEEDQDIDDEPPQEEDIDQEGDEVDQEKEDEQEIQDQRPPHPRVYQAIQRDHPVNSILGDIHKGVTTQSHVAHFCEHYSFVSSIEPYSIGDAPRDPDWVVAMQEELNNFTRNEVWHLVPCPNQNVVRTKWVFRNKQDEHGVVTTNRARLVAKGYSQVEGLDSDETYAPVARLESF
jgi:hypothetical protein